MRYHKVDGSKGWKVDQKSFSNFWYQVQGDLTPNALDPRTWHHNILGLSYAGANNPKKYNGQDDDTKPDQIEDIPAYEHDLGYNKLNIQGANGLFTSDAAIPLDLTLGEQEMIIASSTTNPITRFRALVVGGFVGGVGITKLLNEIIPQIPKIIKVGLQTIK